MNSLWDGFHIRCKRSPNYHRRNIVVEGLLSEDKKCFVALPPELKEIEIHDATEYPLCTLNPTQSQKLMDDLWSCGVRPTEGEGSAGSMSAVQEHLSDMRKITGHKLGISL